jgi:hypothetical protein
MAKCTVKIKFERSFYRNWNKSFEQFICQIWDSETIPESYDSFRDVKWIW